MQVYASKTVTV